MVARRLVAQHCLYGVDKNPFAVNLARLSLWLETLSKEHPFTFLDHVLREGDSLVGATREQVQYVRIDPITLGVQLPVRRGRGGRRPGGISRRGSAARWRGTLSGRRRNRNPCLLPLLGEAVLAENDLRDDVALNLV